MEFHQALKCLSHVINSDATRRNLNAIRLEEQNGRAIAVAVDGFRLAAAYVDIQLGLFKAKDGDPRDWQNKLLPRAFTLKATPETAREGSKRPIELTEAFLKQHESKDVFPNWMQVVPALESMPIKIIVNRKTFLAGLTELRELVEEKRAPAHALAKAHLAELTATRDAHRKTAKAKRAELKALQKEFKAAKPEKALRTEGGRLAERARKMAFNGAVAPVEMKIGEAEYQAKVGTELAKGAREAIANLAKGTRFGILMEISEMKAEISLTWHDPVVGKAVVKIAAEITGTGRIGINDTYCVDALKAAWGEKITLFVSDERSPLRLEHEQGYEVIMPMRI